ncbi:MAG: hypothetical protein OXE40_10345 [Gammaproteobacteria bacterium]|nr:hypothetical protein [Gammaproteobacteria bacterium]
MAVRYERGYLEARGISSRQALETALDRVLGAMEPMVHDRPASGFTTAEQNVLRDGGLRLERTSGRDLAAEGAVRFAALVARSLKPDEVSRRLQVTPGRVHQLISERSLYSFRLESKRLLPDFQLREGKLIPNIGQVNRLLPQSMHPLGVLSWYETPNSDLPVGDVADTVLSPLEWLETGRDVEPVKTLARHL